MNYPEVPGGYVQVRFKRGPLSNPKPIAHVPKDSPAADIYREKMKDPYSNIEDVVENAKGRKPAADKGDGK